MASEIVTLCVSGTTFHATKTVLFRSPFFKQLLQTNQMVYSIHRDAAAFEYVLSLLHDPTYPLPTSATQPPSLPLATSLKHELDFFGIVHVVCACPHPLDSWRAYQSHNYLQLSTFEDLTPKSQLEYEGLIELVPLGDVLKIHACHETNTGERFLVSRTGQIKTVQVCWNTVILLKKPSKTEQVGHDMLFQMLKRFDLHLTSVLAPKCVEKNWCAALLIVMVDHHSCNFV